jgi:hypothetical protein
MPSKCGAGTLAREMPEANLMPLEETGPRRMLGAPFLAVFARSGAFYRRSC